MSKVLIVADNPLVSDSIKTEFSKAGWATDGVNLQSVINHSNYVVGENNCVLMVIDEMFLSHFGKYVDEMASMIRNCAICTSFYLAFEGDYNPIFASWLEYTKRLFKSVAHPHNLQLSVQEIIKLETKQVPRNAYFSPMDAF